MKGKRAFLTFAVLVCVFCAAKAQECLPNNERVDCHPDPGASATACVARGCTWCPVENNVAPSCFVPLHYGYSMIGTPEDTGNGFRVQLVRNSTGSMFGRDSEALTLDAVFQSDYRLRIRISDGTPRWQVPLQINPPEEELSNPLYSIEFSNSPRFSFKVTRRSTGTVLLDTNLGGLTISDQFIQIAFRLASPNLYGLGEIQQTTFRHDFSERRHWGMWGRDQPPYEPYRDDNDNRMKGINNYGVQPYFTVLEEDGNAHSVAIVNSNAQDFETQPGSAIVYRTIGGILDMYVFLGPTPENTVQQYTEAVGRAPLPPYWALGFQLCRYGYNHINEMKKAVDRTRLYDIPHDVQYGDIDIMDRALTFTYDRVNWTGLPEYIKELKEEGIKFMTILDPCISIGEPAGTYEAYDLGNIMDVWYKKQNGEPVVGKVWPEDPVHFPDFSNPSTQEWWKMLIIKFHDLLEYDGLWIDMNEPANFVAGDLYDGCESNRWNEPPYLPKILGNLSDKTICPDHVAHLSTHYNTHSLYGWFQSLPTLEGTNDGTGKRAFVLSRSTFLGSGKWVAHWLGDNFSNTTNMHLSIIGLLAFNHYGIPFVGSDICGFFDDTTELLCQRWMQLGAFYPFARNHNGINWAEQDPGAWGASAAASSRKVLRVRYTLIPYLYTLLANHYVNGNTVVRALWHEFPTDATARGIDKQFMWGVGLMISPVLANEADTTVSVYFPNSRFYDYYTGSEITVRGNTTVLQAPLDHINLHVHGGSVIPTQEYARNTMLSRNNPFGLIVALNDNRTSAGYLYYDSGDSHDPIDTQQYYLANYKADAGTLTSTIVQDGWSEIGQKRLEYIRLLGAGIITSVTVNNNSHSIFTRKPGGEVFIGSLNLPMDEEFTLTYR